MLDEPPWTLVTEYVAYLIQVSFNAATAGKVLKVQVIAQDQTWRRTCERTNLEW